MQATRDAPLPHCLSTERPAMADSPYFDSHNSGTYAAMSM